MADEQLDQQAYTPQYQVLTAPLRIHSILRPIRDKHSLISASFKNSTQLYNTAILDIDIEKNTLSIDELYPADGNQILSNQKQMTFHTLLDGVDVNFNARLLTCNKKEGIDFFVFQIPDTIRYRQRRNAYRVPAENLENISVQLSVGDKQTFDGLLYDISTGGLCITFDSEKDPGDDLAGTVQCTIILTDKSRIQCGITIRHHHHHKQTDKVHLGCKFKKLDKQQHRVIEKLVAGLQRKFRKKDQQDVTPTAVSSKQSNSAQNPKS